LKIAISGHSGCGNTTATHTVAKILSIQVLNYTFRNLAQDLQIPFETLQERSSEHFIFDYLTDLVLMRQSQNANVIVGSRLAAWNIDSELRIWLYASLEARASRINKREQAKGIPYEEVLYTTLKRDEQNRKRYLQVYGIDINDRSELDITINTESLSVEQVSSLIVSAAQWAQANSLHRTHNHLPRIKKIIAKNLNVSEDLLFDPLYKINLQEIYQNSLTK
jgi:CMP/dCMP kinase